MKLILILLFSAMCYGCFPGRELQAELTYATLVKVEEISRYPNLKQKVLTWETEKSVSFVTYESPTINLPIGTRTRVLLQK